MFNNWVGMDNAIFLGLRYGSSNFSNKVESYNIRNSDAYFSNFVENNYETIDHNNLTGSWLEIVAGVKVETFKNISEIITEENKSYLFDIHNIFENDKEYKIEFSDIKISKKR